MVTLTNFIKIQKLESPCRLHLVHITGQIPVYTSSSYDHLSVPPFDCDLNFVKKALLLKRSLGRPQALLGLTNWTFPLFLSSHKRPLRVLLETLSNHDDDHNDDFKKTIGLMIKTTALHVNHAF